MSFVRTVTEKSGRIRVNRVRVKVPVRRSSFCQMETRLWRFHHVLLFHLNQSAISQLLCVPKQGLVFVFEEGVVGACIVVWWVRSAATRVGLRATRGA